MPVWFTIILCKQSCGRGLFPKNLPRVNYTQTCHRISTLQRQTSTGQCVLLKDRACNSQYNTITDKSRALSSILSLLICFISFVPIFLHTLYQIHSCTAHLFPLPELRWTSLIWNCASLSFGMSFQVARNTWRSEKQRDKRSSCERTPEGKKGRKQKRMQFGCNWNWRLMSCCQTGGFV